MNVLKILLLVPLCLLLCVVVLFCPRPRRREPVEHWRESADYD